MCCAGIVCQKVSIGSIGSGVIAKVCLLISFFGKKIFIVSEQKNRQRNYKQMLYTTYIIIYKIQK